VRERHHAGSAVLDGQEFRHFFQESFLILPCKPVWKYVGLEQIITTNTGIDVYGEPLLVM
jgi:hypothetical protein